MNSMEKLAGHLPAMKVGGRRRRSHTESSISLVKANLQEKQSMENPNKSHHELDVEWEDDKEPEVDHEKTRREEFLQKMKNTRLNNREPQHNFQRNSSRRNNIQQPMKNMIAI
ncbi:hypothetical protein CONCODRAFT_87554 [Conidiobolus coronatus NRRL 28638]|uniref:Uncharacterized protein n=1 Tax=Conidiobolus coronatus (strain ATCC 28846 / CBS 209.66 / NRRL 28638) TaxID=796925 RepID=A0A137NTY0_CONC2|nr:hypothetical protein CONCODRAFT_87554 [Conidiobolus coronatus NRRL 28638]|eukprot:KXN66181.1 hypothetical protein CONCODRAFT_87554 [Conidiobolus coronatus NRRL 28638]